MSVFYNRLRMSFLYICALIIIMELFDFVRPSLVLAPFIKHYWGFESNDRDLQQRIVPIGSMQLIFHFGDQMLQPETDNLLPRSFLGGHSSGYLDIKSCGSVKMLVVVFQPYGVKALLRRPMGEFYNYNIPVSDIDDKPLEDLSKRLQDQQDFQMCVELIEQFFIKRLVGFDSYNYKRLSLAIEAINTKIEIDSSKLADITCLSKKQFQRVFIDYIGATPKDFSRIVRFHRALYILQNNPSISLSQLAFESGYYDQPHMVKEFKYFSGYTPTEYLLICKPYSDYFTQV